ncbi:YheC/YheD family protein [Ammoniphilus sp. CFH 90114]|uniref:YheC/YheD family protein n=1 Tax=Ammoniphilus sp. CFH 90114 TaxID=2493665 RepID=UPI0013E97B4F|nr:YheC/YheD family protein [Ammoniphilus sp. CFH 90114]
MRTKKTKANEDQKKPLLPGSKWIKWKLINQHEDLRSLQPQTELYSPEAVEKFLEQYAKVFIKPDKSYGGRQVIRLQREIGQIAALLGRKKRLFKHLYDFDQWLEPIRKGRLFIVQEGVDLVTLKDHPVDLRTILLPNENNGWEVTGMFAKVAKKGKIVTNVKAGGKVISVLDYLGQAGYTTEDQKVMMEQIENLSLKITCIFSNIYRNKKYGLDLGIDKNRNVKLIEVNSKPSLRILRKVDDNMYLRSIRLRRQSKNRQ